GNCRTLDTLVCGNNLIVELDITNLLQLKFLDISYSYNLIDICTRKLPYDFDINAIGPCYYNLSVCNPANPHIFLAGQFEGCYNIELNYYPPFDKNFFDCNNDGVDDIQLQQIFIPGYYSYRIIPLSGNQISSRLNSQGDSLIKGFWEDEMVYPVDYILYDEGLTIVYGDIDYFGPPTWTTNWILNRDRIFSTILPSDNDTTYAWLRIAWHSSSHLWFIDDYHIHEMATWKPCYLSHSIGSDTTINVGDTLTFNAGDGHDRYYWNTKDTTQTYQFISNKWGGGTWEIISYIENDHCYSSDTLYVTVIGESIISDYEFNQLDVYPNPVRNKLTVTNPSNQVFTFEIYNLNAKRVFQRKFYGKSDNIDVSGLSPGIYICKIASGNKVKTIKIIKN
ncbi:MAG: T9SS type A sorting domain-containing protein, partial [Bacteroidales bacterium]|nr:T9SS type A sorting domain-containing protein [Bacteroidales bacterium]